VSDLYHRTDVIRLSQPGTAGIVSVFVLGENVLRPIFTREGIHSTYKGYGVHLARISGRGGTNLQGRAGIVSHLYQALIRSVASPQSERGSKRESARERERENGERESAREREREITRERARARERDGGRERERERAREGGRGRDSRPLGHIQFLFLPAAFGQPNVCKITTLQHTPFPQTLKSKP